MRSELADKISEMKNGMESLENIDDNKAKKEEQMYENYMEFRKPGYWNEKNEKSENVKDFLKKMNKIKHQLKKKYESDLKKRQEHDKKL